MTHWQHVSIWIPGIRLLYCHCEAVGNDSSNTSWPRPGRGWHWLTAMHWHQKSDMISDIIIWYIHIYIYIYTLYVYMNIWSTVLLYEIVPSSWPKKAWKPRKEKCPTTRHPCWILQTTVRPTVGTEIGHFILTHWGLKNQRKTPSTN